MTDEINANDTTRYRNDMVVDVVELTAGSLLVDGVLPASCTLFEMRMGFFPNPFIATHARTNEYVDRSHLASQLATASHEPAFMDRLSSGSVLVSNSALVSRQCDIGAG
jgi:hypothetical protein